jgi:PTS system mannose-specific IIA component
MIGVLVITHGNLGIELIKAAELIRGKMTGIEPVSIDETTNVEDLKKKISTAIKKVDEGQGVLVLTDLFGGTPSNIALSFMKEGKVEVVTGVNLPMMIKLSDIRENFSLVQSAQNIRDYGIKNIYMASEILSKKIIG